MPEPITGDIQKIRELLPHRYPFLMVDRVDLWKAGPDIDSGKKTGCCIKARKSVTFNEPFFPGHFPAFSVMPGVLQIEAMAQAGALACLFPDGKIDKNFVLASIQYAKFRKPVVPGDTLSIFAEVKKHRTHTVFIEAKCEVDNELASEAGFLAGFID